MLDNNIDRGMKKWQGLMLIEHVKLIQEWQESDNQVERPVLDEFELTLIAEEIERAHKSKSTIKLTYWRDGYLKGDDGKIITIDNKNKSIVIEDPFSTNTYLFAELAAISIID